MILTGRARLAGVIGWPVGHSLSPRLHGYWLERYGVDGAYVPLPVRPEAVQQGLAALPLLGFVGANVTVPHKEAALAAVAEATPAAARIGAVNTLIVRPDGSLHGDNTDGFGFLENLRERTPGWTAAAGPALVLGAGGAARAVVAALVDAAAPAVRIANRHRLRAEKLAADIGGPVQVVGWDERSAAMDDAALVVNTTILGMAGNPPLEIDLSRLPAAAVVTDIVYKPLITPLLAAAAERGNVTVDGLGMLLHQARPGFSQWFGVDPAVTETMRAFVLEGLDVMERQDSA